MIIAVTRNDGGLSIYSSKHDTAEEAAVALESVVPWSVVSFRQIDPGEVPADRTFRNAWKAGVGSIEHDMYKAREIHKENLRRMRAPKLALLDVAYMLADESGDTVEKQRIAAEKQKLRDVTADPAIDAAATPEELKNVMPKELS
ncbi:MAG: hypothetical protein RL651_2089 [Pseudomonadota bacterium]